MLQIRVVLNLIDGRRDLGRLKDRLYVFLEKIRHADGFGFTGLLNCFHGCPGLLQILRSFGIEGCVDEVEVHVIQSKFLERGFKCDLYVLLQFAGEFGNNIEVLPRHAGFLNGCAQLLLVTINLSV